MGMFDSIIVKAALPLPKELESKNIDLKNHVFQTKDLENCLLQYFISEDGFLYEEVVEYDYIPYTEEEKKNKNYKFWNIWKDVVEKNRYNKKIEHHGTIMFYDSFELSEEKDFWVDYKAYFVYGKLDKIEISNTEVTKSLKLHNKECEAARNEHNNTTLYKLKRYTGYSKACNVLSRYCYKVSRAFSTLQMLLLRLS